MMCDDHIVPSGELIGVPQKFDKRVERAIRQFKVPFDLGPAPLPRMLISGFLESGLLQAMREDRGHDSSK
ncbi:MAG: hypothetical protein EBX51_08195, partial [Acidimicrobiia bacterium]|nr:hypothetical protein [Acidimicrobiia bacterium]